MRAPHRSSLSVLVLAIGLAACATPPDNAKGPVMDVDRIRRNLLGEWASLATEVRPSAARNADGTAKAFYLRRDFTYLDADRFELVIVNFADATGAVPLVRIGIKGHMLWRGPHPVAAGAQKVDFVADEGYDVTPLVQGFADVLNKVAAAGYAPWEVGGKQSVFGKSFAPFNLAQGTNFMEYDLVYLNRDLLFWGARHVDGRGFDSDANRPTNLQIPLSRR